jgi:hypothetical protein
MGYVSYGNEGLPDCEVLAILLPDGSRTMLGNELKTGEPKHERVAWLVQEILNRMDDPQFAEASITVAPFSADRTGVKILTLLEHYNPHECQTYKDNTDLTYWDPLSPENCKQGMGNLTPIGLALAWARKQAEAWVSAAPGQLQRRCVLYLLSDGMNNVGPDGRAEKQALEVFNATCEKGHISLATIGYFQSAPGTVQEDEEEKEGRQLLRDLPLNTEAYFESDNVEEILRYILGTITPDKAVETE